uniref:separase n=1 Tax=Lygus hesperus TaxID=30085 RepID=A0A146LNI1_LYGHE
MELEKILNEVKEDLKLMPSGVINGASYIVWTLIQLTRGFEPLENVVPRTEGNPPKLKNFHLTRMPCGTCETERPFTVDCFWPENFDRDPIDIYWEVKNNWKIDKGPAGYINKVRKKATELGENYCRDLSMSSFNVWRVLMLGKLIDADLEAEIRTRLNYILGKVASNRNETKISSRQRYLIYLLAEGSALISEEEIDLGLNQIVANDEVLQDELFNEILAIKTCYTQLPSAKRHAVILILDDHLDLIPWESAPPFDVHPYCRMPSVHFVHLGYRIHRNDIKNGYLEILERETCFYVLNPGNDLPSERIRNFLKTRFPSWVGVINEPPTPNQIIEALASYKLFMYCGHGTGSQYLQSQSIMKIDNLQSIQFLIGCSSGALVDHGGDIEMTGDVLQYIAAGSGCAVAMLWSVTNTDADEMTMEMVNCLLPSSPSNKLNTRNACTAREPELLRAVAHARKCAKVFTNGAALIARGLPAKIVSEKTAL